MLRSKLFIRYVTSYTLMFFIPLFILAVYAFENFNDVLNKEINQNNTQLLEQSKKAIDERVEEMNKLSIQLSNNPYLSSSRLGTDNFLNVVQAIKLLENFSTPSNFYSNFFIYYFDQELIYSPQGTLTPRFFSNAIYKYENWDLNQLQERLRSVPERFVRPAESVLINNVPGKYMTYVAPLPYSSEQPTGAVIFTIREAALYNMLSETLIPNKSSILILDNAFNPVSLLGSLKLEDITIDQEELRQNKAQFAMRTSIDGQSYFMSSITSESTGWTYISYMPTDIVTDKLHKLKQTSIGLFLFLFLCGIILIYVFMHMNFKPLHELAKFSARMIGNDVSGRSAGIESFQSAVVHMSKKINLLEEKVESAAHAMRFRLIQQLLKGRFTDSEEFNIQGAEYGLTITGAHYAVFIVMFDHGNKGNLERFSEALEETFPDSYRIFLLENVQEDQIIVILNSDTNDAGGCEALCASLMTNLKTRIGIQCTIGIGNWHSSLSDISRSYLQASSAIDYWPIRGKHTIIAYQEMEEGKNYVSHYPHQQIELLKEYIAKRDASRFSALLDTIIKHIQDKHLPLITVRLLFYNMIQAIIRAIYRNNFELSEEIVQSLDIVSIARDDSVDDLSARIKAICSELFASLEHDGLTEDKQIDKIKKYIETHYYESDFSLQCMSEHFNFSVSYLSNYFKAQTNRTISEYVNDLRMAKAKAELTQTDSNLQEIAQSVGYLNQSSFIRKFKQTTGITPGAYRELHK
ncbi:helix-turn-helix domain-containing protein [Paenibacillus sp. SAF-054]|uniref:helix-turn-helix domain-containing protein n=1 Tax=unclassified Paenibacillus TaxID=185978 RepID=UPI003F7D8ECD